MHQLSKLDSIRENDWENANLIGLIGNTNLEGSGSAGQRDPLVEHALLDEKQTTTRATFSTNTGLTLMPPR
jgi:hypothetical protein